MSEPNDPVIKIGGRDVRVVLGTTSSVANTAVLVTEAVRAPFETITVAPPPKDPKDDPSKALRDPAARSAGPGFGLALIAVTTVTIVAPIAILLMAAFLSDHATTFQTKAFDLSVGAFWAGLGALIGLITGKAT